MLNLIANEYQSILFNTARFFSSVFEIILAYILLNQFFTFRLRYNRFDFVPFVVLSGVLIVMLQQNAVSAGWRYAVEGAALLLIVFGLYRGALKRKIVGCLLFSVLILVSEALASLLFSILARRVLQPQADNGGFTEIARMALANVIMIMLTVAVSMFAKHFQKVETPFILWVVLLGVPAITLLTFSVFQYLIENDSSNPRIRLYIYVSSFGLLLINLLVFILFAALQKQLELKRSTDMLHSLVRQQERSVKRLETQYNRTRAFRHDIRNHILVMNMLAEQKNYGELQAYLRELSVVLDESDYVRISGITAVDAILNDKMYEAQEKQITTHFDVVNLEKNNVQPIDLCVILSNALDNAIEANCRIADPNARFIRVKAHGNSTFSVISVANPTPGDEKKQGDNTFLTTKPDKENHGFGLKSIENTAKKYNGEMIAKSEDGVFTLVVRLNSRTESIPAQANGRDE